MTAPEKAESALHRSGYVMDTGAAFPPDFRPWPRTSGPWSPTPGLPVIAGVEATGEVLEAGKGIAHKPGTRVTVFLVPVTIDPGRSSSPDRVEATALLGAVPASSAWSRSWR